MQGLHVENSDQVLAQYQTLNVGEAVRSALAAMVRSIFRSIR